MKITVATDFSSTPGGRFRRHGPFSGEEFRDDYLAPKFARAIEGNEKLVVNFDGVAGLPSSFLEEAFGGFVRRQDTLPLRRIRDVLSFETSDPTLEPYIELAERYMTEADSKRPLAARG